MSAHDMVTVIKEFQYRGSTEEWSNTYMLDGDTPTTPALWKTLFDAIAASEKACYANATSIIRCYGYEADNDVAVASYDYKAAGAPIVGTLVITGGIGWAGDQAGWVRMRAGTNVNGKPIYIRKYFHGSASFTTPNQDQVLTGAKTAYVAHANKMVDGTLPGAMKWIAPGGTVGTLPVASAYVTTRTLKRRGRRPT